MTAQQTADGLGIYPREILAILFRRRYWLLLPVLVGLIGAVGAIVMQRPMYKSQATLLIDSAQIVLGPGTTPLSSIANERIAKIRQQVVSRDSLSALIRENGLYPKERAAMEFENVLAIARSAIGVDLVGANQNNNNGSTIAFTLSFTYQDAGKARAVTERLTKQFLVEDKRFRTQQAEGTATFLGRRAEELRRQLSELEEKRRGVEARYAGALPSHIALSAQSGAALRAEVSRIDAESQGIAQQNGILVTTIRSAQQAPPPGQEAVRRAEEKLNQLEAVYSDDYPGVVAARAALAREQAAARRAQPDGRADVIEAEIASGRARIDMLAARRSELVAAIADLDHRSAQAPQAAYELNMIEREYDNIKRQYEALREKQLDAQVAANLQSEDKGERFSVVDEPSMPHESLGTKPMILLLMGVFGGGGAGVALALGFELLRGTIHGEETLTKLLKAPPLGVVPVTRQPSVLPWFFGRNKTGRATAPAGMMGGKRYAG
ncbi:GumC family protein [Sphingomonas sanxanigenens]|uniref:Polysaccharide chain length determinant N-terminal domain-containing protein n=2 Tax=Sphingomonas sanxanigenens TaxID=397260 RepID=W0AAT2_9SPHN|nr:LPS biosynthesis protein [Sphingomonas sanxanigenens]AGQ04616.1 sphingan polymerase [Sphingomonas sanxanigenens]AHE55019.1 hypothetical protein NX02_16705 [Sphingomonas sanxanigenens DSM 19645 = NX02]